MSVVAVVGSRGRMGSTVCGAVAAAPDLELGATVDLGDPLDGLAAADVAVVFTAAGQAMGALRACAAGGTHAVIGTTGFGEDEVAELRTLFGGPEQGRPNAALVANFAIGAVLLMRLAELCAPHFDSAEILEQHHERKVDAPSGTAIVTAARMAASRRAAGVGPFVADPTISEPLPGARGARAEEGIHVHSMRLRGMVASQEVVLGAEGQWLTLRHDTSSRESFMPGVLLAVRRVPTTPGLTLGIEGFLGV